MIELAIVSIRVSLMNYQRVVILKEKDADRYLPIWIGPAEADAIAVRLQDVSVARPLTHDLLRSIIETLGAQVTSVIVNDLSNDTFFARVNLEVAGQPVEVDSRPSDAIALAVRAQVPIYADEQVMEKAGVLLDAEDEDAAAEAAASEQRAPMNEEERAKMSAFQDFINGLDLDDFDTRRS